MKKWEMEKNIKELQDSLRSLKLDRSLAETRAAEAAWNHQKRLLELEAQTKYLEARVEALEAQVIPPDARFQVEPSWVETQSGTRTQVAVIDREDPDAAVAYFDASLGDANKRAHDLARHLNNENKGDAA